MNIRPIISGFKRITASKSDNIREKRHVRSETRRCLLPEAF
ncbi:hypothetical protein BN903_4 [Halorubrum sp. AJ67]|nr:hypothetical protein BN903_4 [Halorubrum sp. AJ67]